MRLSVELPTQAYPVLIEPGGLAGLGSALVDVLGEVPRVVVVSDPTVWAIGGEDCLASFNAVGIETEVCLIGCGETQKTVETWTTLVNTLLDFGVDRSTPVIAVGGGLVGDVAGFAAATVMRGVPFVQVPTTLLAMVDSSVGGKTGVNTRHGKNMVGAFHQPSLVYSAMGMLQTLSSQEFQSGLGEVVKHALLGDRVLFEQCERHAEDIRARDTARMTELVGACVRLKANVVSQDEREGGWRAVLNLGHTVGHAIEASLIGTDKALPHGVCVAFGLVAETAWAEGIGACPKGTSDRLRGLLDGLGLPRCPTDLDVESVLQQVMFDKKVRRGKLRTAVVEDVGRVRLTEVDAREVRDLFHSLPGF